MANKEEGGEKSHDEIQKTGTVCPARSVLVSFAFALLCLFSSVHVLPLHEGSGSKRGLEGEGESDAKREEGEEEGKQAGSKGNPWKRWW